LKILVSGGAGFLGSHLCETLVNSGHHVICVDNFYTSDKSNIAHLLSQPNFELIEHDISIPLNLDIERIFNLASPASPTHYQRDPSYTTKTIILGAINMLDLAKKTGARILQASTSEIYGDPEIHPQVESYWGRVNPIGARACYDEGKRCAETLFFDYWRQFQVEIKVVRIFNTYGPNMQADDGRVISNFINQALSNQDLTIYGKGDQTRSFCYVDDLIVGLTGFMEVDHAVTGPMNLGNTEEITVLKLAEKIIELTRSKSEIIFKGLPEDDPIQRNPNIGLAKTYLDWSPRISLDEGLIKTIDYFKLKNSASHTANLRTLD
jgi:UDP-glucuronate decarboxylase